MPTLPQLAWLQTMIVPAQTTMRVWKVPASVTLAQAWLESTQGTSGLAVKANNFFGVKAVQGEDYSAFPTREIRNGVSAMELANFAKYKSAIDSFNAHGKLLATLQRYSYAMRHTDQLDVFCEMVKLGGYSTDYTYPDLLMKLISQLKLQQYDTLPPDLPVQA